MEFVTCDDVAAAADDLMHRGEDPSLLGVREYFGLVSWNTVYIHLARWRRDQPPINPPGPTVPKNVPSELTDVVRQAMEHHATARVTDLRAKLGQSYGEALGLARIGNRLEEDIEQLIFRAETAEAGIDKLLAKNVRRPLRPSLPKPRSTSSTSRTGYAGGAPLNKPQTDLCPGMVRGILN